MAIIFVLAARSANEWSSMPPIRNEYRQVAMNMKQVRTGLILLLLVAGHNADARECRSYGKYAGEVIGTKDVKLTATLSSPFDRSGYSYKSREPDAIEFQIYNGKPAEISIEVTFASGNVYDLNRTLFPVRRASTFSYPQKEDLGTISEREGNK